MRVRPARCLALACSLAVLAGCGGSSEGPGGGSASGGEKPGSFVNWPLFGRIPERTHYLPAPSGNLDPPLHQAWKVNTHALIEFPPALADGVAYVVNKF